MSLARAILITQWFPPEPAHQPLWIARAMQRSGFMTEVLTGVPNYPSGEVMPGYRATERSTQDIEGLTVHRTPLFPSHDAGTIGRVLNYLSWALSSSVFGLRLLRKAQVNLVYSSPATAAVPAMVAKKLFGVPYVLLIQDIWPDSIFSSGFLTGRLRGWVERALTVFVHAAYRSAHHIVVISPGMVDLLESRGVPRGKISVVYNWIQEPASVRERLPRQEIGAKDDEFVLMYAGNLGAAQSLDVLIKGVGCLPPEAGCRLVLVGEGVEKDKLRRLADRVAPERVTFLDARPRSAMAGLMNSSDAQVVSLADEDLFKVTMPSKLQSVLAAGRPVLAVAAGDVKKVVESAGCGEVAQPGSPSAVAAAIVRMRSADRSSRLEMGERGRQFYLSKMSEEVGSKRLAAVLSDALERRK